MQLTLEWLKKYIDLKPEADLKLIEQTLNDIGLEVDDLVDNSARYKAFVIASIEECIPHPNAEKLKICTVFDGQNRLQIVCGALNARANLKVVLAPIGSTIPANGLLIKESKIRGIISQGMLCSAEELSLDHEGDNGIIELPDEAIIGSSFAEFAHLNNVIIKIGLTPNRRLDAACIIGIARDLAASDLGEFRNCLESFGHAPSKYREIIKAKIEATEFCHELRLSLIENVKNSSITSSFFVNSIKLLDISPDPDLGLNIVSQLSSLGHYNALPLVMLSNFAMFDLGRPNHIYDADKIEGLITVRLSKEGESFKALNGQVYNLPANILVVADEKKILAIAGIIGGEESKVTESTTNIIVEVAYFDRDIVAKAGRLLNIQSDSRYRFEGGLDYAIGLSFENYLLALIHKNCGGKLIDQICLVGKKLNKIEDITFNPAIVEKRLGYCIEQDKMDMILSKLGFTIKASSDSIWQIKVPSHRQGDISGQDDIIEEIVRIYSIDQVTPLQIMKPPHIMPNIFINNLRQAKKNLNARGMMEIITWSFIDKEDYILFGHTEDLDRKMLQISNPLSRDMAIMRSSMIPSHLRVAAANLNRDQKDIALFECAKVYKANDNEYLPNKKPATSKEQQEIEESFCLTGIRLGRNEMSSLHPSNRIWDFFDIKADVMRIFQAFDISSREEDYIINHETPPYYHPGRSASIFLGKKLLAYCGEIHPKLCKKYDIPSPTLAFEVFIQKIPLKLKPLAPLHLSKYQAVQRDLAFAVDISEPAINLLKTASTTKLPNVTNIRYEVELFDVHYDKSQADKEFSRPKSIALRLTMQAYDRTLSDAEIQLIVQTVVEDIVKEHNAILRDGK